MQVDGTNLTMIRGDSETITVAAEDGDGVALPFETGDTIYFTVKANTLTTTKLIQKSITAFTDGAAVIELLPEDTKPLRYGSYRYDVQWVHDGRVTTVVPPSSLVIAQEVTFE